MCPDQAPEEVRNCHLEVRGVPEASDVVRHGSSDTARGDHDEDPRPPRVGAQLTVAARRRLMQAAVSVETYGTSSAALMIVL